MQWAKSFQLFYSRKKLSDCHLLNKSAQASTITVEIRVMETVTAAAEGGLCSRGESNHITCLEYIYLSPPSQRELGQDPRNMSNFIYPF